MKKNQFLFILLICLGVFSNMQAQKSVLYLGKSDPAGAEDQLIVDSITSYGYTVTYVDQTTFEDYTTADKYTGFDAFVVSETISSTKANPFKDAGYPLPCITMEGYGPRDEKWSWWTDDTGKYLSLGGGSADGEVEGMTIVIENNSHYITQEYAAKEEVTWSIATDFAGAEFVGLKLTGTIPTAIALASSTSAFLSGYSVLWAIPENSALFDNRMVFFPTHVKVIGEGEATAEMYNIIKRSLTWVLKDDASSVDNISNALDVQLMANPVSNYANFKINALDKSNVSVSVISLNGQQVLLQQEQSLSNGNVMQINTSTLADGLYLYRVVSGGKLSTGKMLVEK